MVPRLRNDLQRCSLLRRCAIHAIGLGESDYGLLQQIVAVGVAAWCGPVHAFPQPSDRLADRGRREHAVGLGKRGTLCDSELAASTFRAHTVPQPRSSLVMTNPAPQPSPQRFQRVRALFERANSLPMAQREAFVRAQAAGDEALAAEVWRCWQSIPSRRPPGFMQVCTCSQGRHHPSRMASHFRR